MTEAPKINMKTKKKAIDAEAVGFSTSDPLKLRRMDTIIMQIPRPKEPQIIGVLRPTLSTKNVGKRLPTTNMICTHPPMIRDRFLLRPTLLLRTVGMKYLFRSVVAVR